MSIQRSIHCRRDSAQVQPSLSVDAASREAATYVQDAAGGSGHRISDRTESYLQRDPNPRREGRCSVKMLL